MIQKKNGTPNKYSNNRPPEWSPSDKQCLKPPERRVKQIWKIHRCFCPSFHCEKTTQHYEIKRMSSSKEAVTEDKTCRKLNKEAAGFLRTMDCPPHSPDLNITECVRDDLDHEMQKVEPCSRTDFWSVEKYHCRFL